MKCPYCSEDVFAPEEMVEYTKKNGEGVATFRCSNCRNLIEATGIVTVVFGNVKKSTLPINNIKV